MPEVSLHTCLAFAVVDADLYDSGDFDAPLMPIYYRPSKKSGLEALFQKFPREALITFSDKFRKQLLQPIDPENPPKAIYLDKGGNKEAFKEIFNWIKQCIAEAGVAEFEKVSTISSLNHRDLVNIETVR